MRLTVRVIMFHSKAAEKAASGGDIQKNVVVVVKHFKCVLKENKRFHRDGSELSGANMEVLWGTVSLRVSAFINDHFLLVTTMTPLSSPSFFSPRLGSALR